MAFSQPYDILDVVYCFSSINIINAEIKHSAFYLYVRM